MSGQISKKELDITLNKLIDKLGSEGTDTIPVSKGGTGATTTAEARTNLGITPANIGAASASHTHNYAGSSSAGGSATSAVKLATARTIRTNLASTGTASFDGSANITPGVTGVLGVSNGGTGATSTSAALSKLGAFSKYGGTIAGNVIIGSCKTSYNNSCYTLVQGAGNVATGFGSSAQGCRSIASFWTLKIKSIDISTKRITFDDKFGDFRNVFPKLTVNKTVFIYIEDAYIDSMITTTVKSIDTTNYSIVINDVNPDYTNYSYLVIDHFGNSSAYSSIHAEGYGCVASGCSSHAEGYGCVATGIYSHAEGYNTSAGYISHAEGYNTSAGYISHTEGYRTIATGNYSHSEGDNTTASGKRTHAEGYYTEASGDYSHAQNYYTIADKDHQTAMGRYNKSSVGILIVGKGTNDYNRANCFRVTETAVYATGNYNSTGADYAEYFEWEDGNKDNEDRVGLFVTLKGNKITLSNDGDKMVLGIISGNPSVIGDSHEDQWNGMYLYDIYGRPIMEEVEIPEKKELREIYKNPILDEEGNDIEQEKEYEEVIVEPARTEIRQKLNPNYNSNEPYIPRSERKEWDVVGMLGKLVLIDDGSCIPCGYAKPDRDGKATSSKEETKYYVMERINDNHIRVMVI